MGVSLPIGALPMLSSQLSRIIPKGFLLRQLSATSLTRSTSTMATPATPYHVQVQTANSGLLKFKRDDQTAEKVSELLQKDLDKHHVFFNTEGFHNHIPHHLLTLYGTGAQPAHLEKAYASNASYQLKATTPKSSILQDLQASYSTTAPQYLGKGKHYSAFLSFFQSEIESKGWREVLAEYVFQENDAQARDLFERLYAGFLHPMIQLMFGVEWEQPAIVAEALAQAAVHENKLGEFMTKADEVAKENKAAYKPLTTFFEDLKKGENRKLAESADFKDANKIYDGIMKRAPQEALDYVSQIQVREDELEERTAEMIHNSAYITAASAWNPPHIPKYDFFLIHHLNSGPIFLTLNNADWVPISIKIRLLEWKMRLDVLQYIARGCPTLHADILKTYTPLDKNPVSTPRDLLSRFFPLPDDGHTIKVVRSLLIAQEETEKWGKKDWVRVDGEDWLRLHYLLLDGVEGQQSQWVRAAGFEEAWKDVPLLETGKL